MDAQVYVHHWDIYIQYCVREFVHLKYPGKKKVKH